MIIWLSILSFFVLVIAIACLIIIFRLIPGIGTILSQILVREQRTLATINKLKMFLRFEENIDVDKPLPFDVKVEPNNNK